MTATPEGCAQREPTHGIRVMIVSDVRLYREGLAHVLALHAGIEIVDDPTDGLAQKIRGCRPDVIVADSGIVRSTSIAATAMACGARVVAVAVAEDNEREVLACAEAGVSGFVARDATMDELAAAVRTAASGGLRCSPAVGSFLARRVASVASWSSHAVDRLHLTRREFEIGMLIDQGLSNKEIAGRLRIEPATVKNHVHNILEKLQVHRRGEAAAALRGQSSTLAEPDRIERYRS